jgi:hypothetical protein
VDSDKRGVPGQGDDGLDLLGPIVRGPRRPLAAGVILRPARRRPAPNVASGLVLPAYGHHAENDVDVEALVRQGRALRGFRVELAHAARSHPFTVRRLERLSDTFCHLIISATAMRAEEGQPTVNP